MTVAPSAAGFSERRFYEASLNRAHVPLSLSSEGGYNNGGVIGASRR
jgi:hypothetical protein